jgi:dipeptide/tripeptide permease
MATQTFPQTDRPSLLRRTIQADSVFSLLGGLLLLIDSELIATLIGLPWSLAFVIVGIGLIGYAALLFLAARRTPIDRRQALGFLVADVAWVLASVVIVLGGWAPLTPAGFWGVLIVADIVAVFAVLKYIGLRRLA